MSVYEWPIQAFTLLCVCVYVCGVCVCVCVVCVRVCVCVCVCVQAFNLVRAGDLPDCPTANSGGKRMADIVHEWCTHAPDLLR